MNEEIQKVLKMAKEGTVTEEQAAELIAELARTESRSSREWKKEGVEGLGDTISTLIGKTMEGAISMSGFAGKNTSHVEGFSPSDLRANSFHMSKVEAPDGEDFVFKNNQIRMSHLKKLSLQKAEFNDNQIDASKLDRVSVSNGNFTDSTIQASAVERFGIERSQMSRSKILSSKWDRVSIEGESSLEKVKVNACAIKGLRLSNQAHLRDSVLSGSAVSDMAVENSTVSDFDVQNTHIVGTSILNSSLVGVLLRGIHLAQTKFFGCKMNDVLFSGGNEKWNWKPWKSKGIEKVSFENCNLNKVLISQCSWSEVTIKNVTLTDFKIEGVALSGVILDGNEEFLKALEVRKSG